MQSAFVSSPGHKKKLRFRAKFVCGQLSLHALVHFAVLLQTFFHICYAVLTDVDKIEGSALFSHCRLLFLMLVEVSTLIFVFYVAVKSFAFAFTESRLADLALVFYGLILPFNNIAFYLFLPSFDLSKRNYWSFMTVTSVLGSALADFTPMYSLTHWALSMPIYMYLDMSQALGSAASNPCVNNTMIGAPPTCPTWTAALMLQYLIKRGLSLALLGLVSGVGSSLLFLDSRRQTGSSNTTSKGSPGLQPKHLSTIFRSHTVYCCGDEGEKTGHCNQHEELMTRESLKLSSGLLQHDVSGHKLSRTLPFQSFGIISRRSFFFIPISISCYDAIISILYKKCCYVDDMLFFLAQSVHSLQSQHPAILQFLMLVPVIVYYAFRLCAARLFSSELTSISRISPEEWMIALVFYFLIGRCTLDMDLASFLDFCARSARSASSAASISFSINRKPHSTLSEMLDSVRDLVKNKNSAGFPLSQNAGFCRTSVVSSQQLPSDPTTNCSPAAPAAGRAAGHTNAWQPATIIAQALRCSGYYYHGRMAPDNGQRLVLQSQLAISAGQASAAGTTIAVEDCSPSDRPLEAVEKLHEQLKYLDTIGEGSFGRVYLGLWQGNLVAVKEHVMSPDMTDLEKHERMALMEVVVSSSLSHPNIIQTYTYGISSLQLDTPASSTGNMKHSMQNLEDKVLDHPADPPSLNSQKDKEALKVQIVMELCECGNLRDLLQNGVFKTRLSVNYRAVLDVALDVARGMAHLHSMGLVHSDLKASNILIRKDPYGLGGPDDLGIIAKISDFGLTLKIDSGNGTHTHVSGEHCCGTLSHMAPEVLKEGRQSMAADVYSFGILLWELLSGGKAYKEVPNVLLGRKVVEEGYRPEFPPWAPEQYISLAKCCWNQQPSFRPDFQHILLVLSNLRVSQGGLTKELQVKASIIRDRLNSALDTPSEKTTSMIILNSLAYCSSVSTPPGSWNVQKQQQIPTTHSVSNGTSCNRNQRRQHTFQPAASERSQILRAKQHYSRMLKSGSPSRFPGSGPIVKRGSAEGELYSKKCRVHQNNKRGNSRVEGHEPFRTMLKDADNSLCSSAPQVKCPVIVPHHEYPSQQQRLEVPEEMIKSSGLTMTTNENSSVVRQVLGYDWMLGPNNAASARPQNVNHDHGEVSGIIAGLLSTSTISDAGTTFETDLDKMQPQQWSHKAIKQHQFEASSSLPHVGRHINSAAACHHEGPAAHHKGEATTLMALQKHVLLVDEGNEDGGAAGREGSKLVGHQDGNIEYDAVKADISAEQGQGNLFTHLCYHDEDDSCSSHILRILS